MYRFALRPWWILSHLVVIAIAVLFVNLGFWQLRRYDERVASNAVIEARRAAPEVDVADLPADADGEELRYRSVAVQGSFADGALLIDNRSHDGLPGGWLVAPFVLEDGSTIAVSRGFLGYSGGAPELPAPPAGSVTVHGRVLDFADGCATRSDDAGQVVGASCLDRDAAQAAFGTKVAPIAIQQAHAEPADDASLVPVPLPELGEGSHRSYAAQWFIFTAIGLIGYPLILRRVARDRARPEASATMAEVDA